MEHDLNRATELIRSVYDHITGGDRQCFYGCDHTKHKAETQIKHEPDCWVGHLQDFLNHIDSQKE